jgi:hypothetical protein
VRPEKLIDDKKENPVLRCAFRINQFRDAVHLQKRKPPFEKKLEWTFGGIIIRREPPRFCFGHTARAQHRDNVLGVGRVVCTL